MELDPRGQASDKAANLSLAVAVYHRFLDAPGPAPKIITLLRCLGEHRHPRNTSRLDHQRHRASVHKLHALANLLRVRDLVARAQLFDANARPEDTSWRVEVLRD